MTQFASAEFFRLDGVDEEHFYSATGVAPYAPYPRQHGDVGLAGPEARESRARPVRNRAEGSGGGQRRGRLIPLATAGQAPCALHGPALEVRKGRWPEHADGADSRCVPRLGAESKFGLLDPAVMR
eukprot:763429-Hanusia_phi.AAC.4